METEKHPGDLIDEAMYKMELRQESSRPIRFSLNYTDYEVALYPAGWAWVMIAGDETAENFFRSAYLAQQDAIANEQRKVDAEEQAKFDKWHVSYSYNPRFSYRKDW